ncbi:MULTISPECIES: sulfite exporter TauE/SafE family protein [Microvirga]|uniref:sulfite exporter TauE/SafE family protein n=1 Tax=Microvirga TaxID=186650 RepID=UPI001CFFAA96|nr:sulfite exporter TauE/SafE family protein [Microvirga lenta]MCB5176723.1 sulfite exporter TauE/SafE family protein [Microvirga lenta]
MSAAELVGFLLLAGAAAYAQTLTGFAFGLITMGGIALTGLLPLTDAAAIVSVLTLVNATQMLLKGWRDVAWREFWLVMATSVPFLFAGYALLEWLAETRTDLLRLILGLIIIVSSLQLARKPEPLGRLSGSGSFLFFGSIAGLMGGLYSTAGPPLVYHFYRQPMPLVQIRETLVTVFALNAVFRIGLVGFTGNLPTGSAWFGLLAVPMVMGATYAARRWPPPLSPKTTRRIVFVLLFLSGASLAAPALVPIFGSSV